MSHLSRMKNPKLPYLSVAAALPQLRPAFLDVFELLRNHYFLLQLNQSQGSLCPSQASADQLPCAVVVSCILTTPCMLSLVDHYHIRLASPPPRAIKDVRGIYLLTTIILSKRDIYYYALGIFYAQALARPFLRVTTPLKGDRRTVGRNLGCQVYSS